MVEHGLRYAEIRMVDGRNIMELSDSEIINVKEQLDRRGLSVSAVASPVFKCALDPLRPVAVGDTFGHKEESVSAHFEKLKRAMEIAKMLDTRMIRIFSFWRESDPAPVGKKIIQHLRRAADLAEAENMLLLLENEPSCNGGTAPETAYFVNRVNSSALRVVWDPGNEQFAGRAAYPDGYEQVKNIVAHVHLKDVRPGSNGLPECVPIGSGVVAYREQLARILEDGYPGLFIIEPHYIPQGGTAREGAALCLNGLRTLLQSDGFTISR
ncbi:sugar phosphate isomerase/epimerase [Cohnella pontilimi]|uniref:Sugar phosphate isomerase/epimerase n=2 Tax=Cohnella pontilimi TaxID=2564100 RepID=A0A4U0FI07_9BACL|nr:sugar phosphate isomerase/epimerase [Cohnella pontilimi]